MNSPNSLAAMRVVFSLLIIHVWHPHNDIQMGVELSPLSNFDIYNKGVKSCVMERVRVSCLIHPK